MKKSNVLKYCKLDKVPQNCTLVSDYITGTASAYYPINLNFFDPEIDYISLMDDYSRTRLKAGDFRLLIYYSEGDNPNPEINNSLKIFDAIYEPINLKEYNLNNRFLSFCGIGNPHEFENTLKKFKFKIKEKFIFPDHYNISDRVINNMKDIANKNNLKIITTEKDFLRLSKKQQKGINFLKVKLKIQNLSKLKKFLTSNI